MVAAPQHDHDVMRLLSRYCAQTRRTLQSRCNRNQLEAFQSSVHYHLSRSGSLKQAALELGFVGDATFDPVVDLNTMVKPKRRLGHYRNGSEPR